MKHTAEEHVQLMYRYAAQLNNEVEAGEILPDRLGRSLTTQWAVVKAIELIGEEAWELHKANADLGKSIDLAAIAGMRHRLVHHYEGVDWNIVESVLSNDIPQLVCELKRTMCERGIIIPKL